VAAKSMHEVSDFVTQKLAPIEGVTATASYFLLKRYKEDGEIISGKEEVKRQAVIL
jgi:DNA-binding Lrp family transcriptional regulator